MLVGRKMFITEHAPQKSSGSLTKRLELFSQKVLFRPLKESSLVSLLSAVKATGISEVQFLNFFLSL